MTIYEVHFGGRHQLYDCPSSIFYLDKYKAFDEALSYKDNEYYWADVKTIEVIE